MFCFFAAVLLLLVSLGIGLLRRDFRGFFSRTGLIHLGLALGIATLLLGCRFLLLGLPYQEPPSWFPDSLQTFFSERMLALFPETFALADSNQVTRTWPLAGISRLPLYIFALAYGPSAGLIAGLLFAPIAFLGLPAYPELLLALELCILGWLAIVPSSFQHRWAGSFNAILAYALTFFSAGFAYLLWRGLSLDLDHFWRLLHPSFGGVLLSSLLLLFFGPKFFQKSFKDSKIIYETIEAGLEDIVIERSTQVDEALTVITASDATTSDTGSNTVNSLLDDFSPSVSTTLNVVSQADEAGSNQARSNQDVAATAVGVQDNAKSSKRGKRVKKSRGARAKFPVTSPAQQNQASANDSLQQNQVTIPETQTSETSGDTNIFLTNVDDLLRVTGIEGSVYSELLNDLPDHLSEETLWLINFLLTEAKASTINTVYKSFKGSFGANKKRFKKGIKEAHAEGWLTLMRDIEKDEVFVGLGRKLLVQN